MLHTFAEQWSERHSMDWHDRYALNPQPFGIEPTPFLREVFEDPDSYGAPGGSLRILCPGDGYGRNGLWLARRGHSVVAFDLVRSAVARALSDATVANLDYLAIPADLSESPFPLSRGSSFEAVVLAWMRLPGEAARRSWNAECVRKLQAGGIIIFVGGQRVTGSLTEQKEWPPSISWLDLSTKDEVRMVGRKECLQR